MGFKYRLETSLRLADQEQEIAQGLLAREMRTLNQIRQNRDNQADIYIKAVEGQKMACLNEPGSINLWQRYLTDQKNKLEQFEKEVTDQELITAEFRKKLIDCRINLEKFKRLKQKKWKLYYIDELKKEQAVIDEIPQSRQGYR